MITLSVHPARCFFDGKKKELHKMYHALRVRDKSGSWKAFRLLRRLSFFHGQENRKHKIEKIKEQSKWVKFYNLRNDSFCSGLLERVTKYLESKHIEYVVKDYRPKIAKFEKVETVSFEDEVETRPEQLVAINAALQKGRGILSCATNAGKTLVAAAVISEAHKRGSNRVLYLVHRVGLAAQTQKVFRGHFGKEIQATVIGGGKKKIPSHGILIATVQTAGRLLEKKNVEFKAFLEKCNVVFIDELHTNKAWTVSNILDYCKAPMRIGLSGTIDKNSKTKMMYYTGLTGPIIAEVTNSDLIGLGRSAKPHIRMVEVVADRVTGSYAESYRNGIVNNRTRNKLIVRETLRYVKKNYPTLVIVARIQHGHELLKRLQGKMDVPVEFIQGSTPLPIRKKIIDKFERGDISVLIASPIFDTGVDIPDIKGWVCAAGGRGWELVLQRVGRVLRKKTSGRNEVFLTDMVDRHNNYLFKHSLQRMKHYKKEGFDMEIIQHES